MQDSETKDIILENIRRREQLFSPYNPVTGIGSPIPRVKLNFSAGSELISIEIPERMYTDNRYLYDQLNELRSVESLLRSLDQMAVPENVIGFIKDFTEVRFDYDFEYWAYSTVKIQDKESKQIIPFKLNRPQRKLLGTLEKMRLAGLPIRIILLKARQWGGSTLVQIYMAWIQLRHKTNWHSVVVTDVEDQARNIRGMYSRMAKEYPKEMGSINLVPFEGSSKNRMIAERDCVLGVGSVQKPDSLRSFDFAMSHLSEVGLWKSTPQKSAEDLVQNIRSSIPTIPYSLAVLESTAKGTGNFFHREWQAAVSGKSAYEPVFVSWFEIERNQKPIEDLTSFVKWMKSDPYAVFLWGLGATLEGIKWYYDFKNGENYDDWRMKSEAPSTAEEAFQSTGQRVFAQDYVNNARKSCMKPEFIGDIQGRRQKGKDAFEDLELHQNDKGLLFIWAKPDKTLNVSDRYVTVVDIGGRTSKADWSVIKVFDRYWMSEGGKPEVVATWRGHLDQDLVAWKAAQISRLYNNALLIVESNSLASEAEESEGTHFLTVLNEIVKYYSNIYARTDQEKIRQGIPLKYGFHTDRSTKPMVIDELNGALREESYYERDLRACDEMDTYEIKPNGSYGAVEGCKDDLVMTTAIGVWACFKLMSIPKIIVRSSGRSVNKIVSEATI